jgi:SAM-dependent methyltransferase
MYVAVTGLDIASFDKIPVIRKFMREHTYDLALDIGIGTGYTTRAVLGDTPTVCLDIHESNLRYFRTISVMMRRLSPPVCIVADAVALPFKPKTFSFILCSEVLEHLKDDESAVRELARVLANDGRTVITVPYIGLKFASFLELLRIPTVHDSLGPEHHERLGYDRASLSRLLNISGLELEASAYYLRFFTRVIADVVSLVHLFYERTILNRSAWTWADATSVQNTRLFKVYSLLFPVLSAISRLDRFIQGMPGFGLIAVVRKRPNKHTRATAMA